jgi:hypothetical protein
VDPAERPRNGRLDPFVALHALVGRRLDLRGVERVASDGIGERRGRATLVDRGLRALGLELTQDGCQLGNLLLLELQPVGEEPERPPDAEPASPELVTTAAASTERPAVGPLVRVPARPPEGPAAGSAAPFRTALFAGMGLVVMTVPMGTPETKYAWMHGIPPRRGYRSRRVLPRG